MLNSSLTMERTYTLDDKRAERDWDPGEWDHEPDKIQWIDSSTGLDCLIVRGPAGALCGYVGVPPEHAWHGIDHSDRADRQPEPDDSCDYEARIDHKIDIHGGLTYSAACQEGTTEADGICHVPFPGRPGDVWWFGFDCAHSGDLAPSIDASRRVYEFRGLGARCYRNVAYVRRECASLARQLALVSS